MAKNRYVIGVDGGNNKTTAVVLDGSGAVVGVGDGGCTDIYSVASPPDALDRVVSGALQQAGCEPGDLRAGLFSLAGADWPDDYGYLNRHLRGCQFGFEPVVVNESIGALRLGSLYWEGIAVIWNHRRDGRRPVPASQHGAGRRRDERAARRGSDTYRSAPCGRSAGGGWGRSSVSAR